MSFWKNTHAGLNYISDKVDMVTRWFCVCLILFMTVEVIVAVFFRYALDSPLKWGEELARLAMVWSGLLGIGIALKDGEHIGLEMLTGRLSGRSLAWCKLIACTFLLPFLVILLIWGVKIAIVAWGTFMPALQIKWTWSHLAVPVTAGIQLVHLISRVFEEIMGVFGHHIEVAKVN